MVELTNKERVVLEAVRLESRSGEPARPWEVWLQARSAGGYETYDTVHKALRSLVAKGALTRPSRGRYLPGDTDG